MALCLGGLSIRHVLIPQRQRMHGAGKTLLLDPLFSFKRIKWLMNTSFAIVRRVAQHL